MLLASLILVNTFFLLSNGHLDFFPSALLPICSSPVETHDDNLGFNVGSLCSGLG